jgi:hypothetical protein
MVRNAITVQTVCDYDVQNKVGVKNESKVKSSETFDGFSLVYYYI